MKKVLFGFKKKVVTGIALTAAIIGLTGVGGWAYAAPYSYVSLDVNPSITYTLNRFNRVIDVKAINEDGQEILDHVDGLTNRKIEDAIKETVKRIIKEGYLESADSEDENSVSKDTDVDNENDTEKVTVDSDAIQGGIVITVSNENQDLSKQLTTELNDTVLKTVDSDVEVEVSSIGLDRVKEARALGVSPGKLRLVEKLKASSTNPNSIVTSEWINKPVKEIMTAIHENRKASAKTDDNANAAETSINSDNENEEVQAVEAEENDDLEDTDKLDKEDTDADNDTKDIQTETSKGVRKVKKESTKNIREAQKDAAEEAREAEKDAAEKAREIEKDAAEKARETEKDASEKVREAKKDSYEKIREARKEASKNAADEDNSNNFEEEYDD